MATRHVPLKAYVSSVTAGVIQRVVGHQWVLRGKLKMLTDKRVAPRPPLPTVQFAVHQLSNATWGD